MENTELASEVEAMADAEQQDQAYDQSIPAPERTSQSRWWVSMSSKQRDNYLARQRANYHRHRGQISNQEGNTRVSKRMRLSHICQMSDNVADRNDTSNDDDIVVNEEAFENAVPQNDMPGSSSVAKACDRPRRCKSHNCARNFHENIGMRNIICQHQRHVHIVMLACFIMRAKICCLNGKTVIPPVQSPPEMIELFSAQTPQGAHFRQNIRAYNHIFSFTSMGVHIDANLATGGSTFTFRAQRSIYHKIGSLLPDGDNIPRFLQLYIYDIDHEVDNRMLENEALHRDVVETVQQILNRHNPFVQTFHHLAQRQDMETCRLIIREQPANQLQYSLPSAS